MTNVGIIICGRYQSCGGGKCLRAMRAHEGGFAGYPREETLELVGYSYCGGCPGGNVEYVPGEMIRNGAQVIHLATGMVVGYPPCPRIRQFKEYIELAYRIPVVVGTHPIPLNYYTTHRRLPFWDAMKTEELAAPLMQEEEAVMAAYD